MKVVLFVKRKRIRSRKTPLRRVEHEIDFNDTFNVNVDKETVNDVNQYSLNFCIFPKFAFI